MANKTIREQREYIEECIRLIMQKKDVSDALVIDLNGYPMKSTMSDELTLRHIGLYGQVIDKARFMLTQLDPNDEITFMRIRSKNHEVIITPDDKCIFLVIQNPRSEDRL
ncbi:Dynein light chain roadblock-type 2 [Pseudolycoriella hygida]|uniref:Dynein light chain roadblock-type 2 n=1 Tax=Pseudolycoriella hygida TaxID=35572 RepID=A0A9Q0S613_9DIPT|nr:Dynein light chain roadblock-type 2 [Pseudolycoriella hygida]